MFYRTDRSFKFKIYASKFNTFINKNTIEKTSWRDVHNVLKTIPLIDKEIFLHNVISEWIESKEESRVILKLLKKIIKKSKITLNKIDQENLFIYEARIFASERAIKQLDVNIKLNNREIASVRYENGKLFEVKNIFLLLKKGNIIVTNQRLLIVNEKNSIILKEFYLSQLDNMKIKNQIFQFKYKRKIYGISIYDNKVFYNVINNIINRKVK